MDTMARRDDDDDFTGVDLHVPALTADVDSVQDRLIWLDAALLSGRITPNIHKESTNGCSKILTSISVKEGLGEMSELRELCRRSQALADERKEEQVKKRYAQGAIRIVRFPAGEIPKKKK